MSHARTRRPAHEARAAILKIAESEFARYGIAGARVDRIAKAAAASKERLYSYFGDKESLFEEVMANVLTRIAVAVDIDGDDLPGYTSRLVDYFLDHPDEVRMAAWARLESTAAVDDPDDTSAANHHHKVAEVERAQRAGLVDEHWDPAVLLQLILAIATYWVTDPPAPGSGLKRSRHKRIRRDNAAEAVRRLIDPSGR